MAAAISVSAGRLASWNSLQGHQREDHRRQPARAEPAHQADRVAAQAHAPQRQRHRRHPHDRQAEDGVEDRPPTGVIAKHGSDQNGPEDAPNQQRQEGAEGLGELGRLDEAAARGGTEHHAADESGDEAVAADRH